MSNGTFNFKTTLCPEDCSIEYFTPTVDIQQLNPDRVCNDATFFSKETNDIQQGIKDRYFGNAEDSLYQRHLM